MRPRSSTAVERSGLSVTPRLALVVLVSLAAFFAASFRPISLSMVSAAGTISTYDADAPVAIEEEGRTQCRIAAFRPARDGRGQGMRVRDLPFFSIDPWHPQVPTGLVTDTAPSPSGSRELTPMRRVRRHAEVMVFLT